MSASILTITLEYANIYKKSYFSDLKTIVELNFSGVRHQSTVSKGSSPQWNHIFSLQKTTESFLLVNLYEKGLFSNHLLGEGIMLLDSTQPFQDDLQQIPVFRYHEKIADIFLKLYIDSPLSRPHTKAFKKIPEAKPQVLAEPVLNLERPRPAQENDPPPQKRQEINLAIYGVQLSDLRYDKLIYSSQSGKQEVYLGTIIHTNTPVAIKVSYCEDSDEFNRVQREALALSQLSHPNICKVYGTLLEIRNNKFKNLIVLENCEGICLRLEIEARAKTGMKFFTEEEVWRTITDLVNAFAHIETKNIVHSDVKPDNLVLAQDGLVKVIDFGISLHGNAELFGTTKTLKVGGTIPYFSPLLMQGYILFLQGMNSSCTVRHHPTKSDVYSLGLTLMHMTSLMTPNGLNNLDNELQGRICNAIEAIPYSGKVKSAIEKMLVIDENLRPGFIELEADIKKLN